MKRFLIFMLLLAIGATGTTQPLDVGEAFEVIAGSVQTSIDALDTDSAQSIAIYYFTTNGERSELGDILSQELTTFLAGHSKQNIQIVSRDQVDVIMEEHAFQLSGLIEESQIVDVGKKLSAHFIGTGYLLAAEGSARLNFQLIHVESGEVVAGEILSIQLTDELSQLSGEPQTASIESKVRTLIGSARTSLGQKDYESANRDLLSARELWFSIRSEENVEIEYWLGIVQIALRNDYAFVDTFDTLDPDIWITMRKDKDISIDADGGVLRFFVEDRQGVNAASIYTKDFRVSSFTMETTFRDPMLTSNWISLTVGNKQYADGASFQIVANVYDGYYVCRWRKSGDANWSEDENNIKDDTSYDSDTVFHTLMISYDIQKKIAYAFVDDELVSYVEEFTYNRKDRLEVLISVNCAGKDMHVEFNTFKSTIAFE